MKLRSKFFWLFLCIIAFSSTAQIPLVRDGKPHSRIIVDPNDSIDMQAAILMQDFVKRISNVELPIITDSPQIKKGDIILGNFQLPIQGFDPTKTHRR